MNPAWSHLVTGAGIVIAVIASGHAVLYKRDSRGAMLWVVVIWLIPFLGALFYFGFGINRIKRRAAALRGRRESLRPNPEGRPGIDPPPPAGDFGSLAPLVAIGSRLTGYALLAGNKLEPLTNTEAYPAMLAAIDGARSSIALSTYIFDCDAVGADFARRLGAAVRRGVAVRVLIDATGTFFSWPSILPALRREGVPYARFLPAFSVGHPFSLNLRTHRKLLVVDGQIGFTGGMNICGSHGVGKLPRRPLRDRHFRVTGPVVRHLQEVFVGDWHFTTDEALEGAAWFPPLAETGAMFARGIADGPDETFERTRWLLLAAIAMARTSLRIRTPYFLPDNAIISALNLASLRGVKVEILLPSDSDVVFVQWASTAHWWQMLEYGCRIRVTPPPFDHAKAFVVDEAWTLIGSTNWDPRSLRLNFEFNVECHDAAFASSQAQEFDQRWAEAREITLAEVNGRSLGVRLRDGIARLGAPFM